MQDSPISWTDKTSNPIRALNLETMKEGWFCTKITEGCTHCYSESTNLRYGNQLLYNTAELPKIKWILKEKEFDQWFNLKDPKKIFVCDMTDLFHEDMPIEFISAIFDAMDRAPWHTYQVLTKRPQLMHDFLLSRYFWNMHGPEFILPKHLWIGTTVENRKQLGRIDILRKIPAQVRFLSCEPLLESLGSVNLKGIHWVITGAESGAERRAYREDWAKELRDQCLEQQVAFWYKQGSDRFSGRHEELDGRKWQEFPK